MATLTSQTKPGSQPKQQTNQTNSVHRLAPTHGANRFEARPQWHDWKGQPTTTNKPNQKRSFENPGGTIRKDMARAVLEGYTTQSPQDPHQTTQKQFKTILGPFLKEV